MTSTSRQLAQRAATLAKRAPRIAKRLYGLDGTLTKLEQRTNHLAKRSVKAKEAKAPRPPKNGPLAVAVVGCRSHGRKHLAAFLANPDCHVAWVVDVDRAVAEEAAALVEKRSGRRPAVCQDLREMLADDRVDIVSIATPHHWHATATVWALQAGKHVYVEKPLTHSHAEGQSILAASEKYGRVVQCGTQLRSNTSLQAAARELQRGVIGEIDLVHCITYKPRPAIPDDGPEAVPSTVDLDLWCGPAPLVEPERGRFHYHWHWDWATGNGALGNNGVHRVDVARIGLDLKGWGQRVFSYGGRFGRPDGGETPNTMVTAHQFGNTWVVHEILGLPTGSHAGVTNGIVFHGSDGWVTYQSGAAAITDELGRIVQPFAGKQQNHYDNFVDAVKHEDPTRLNGELHDSHVSSSLCHLGNISYRLGAPTSDREIRQRTTDLGVPQPVEALLTKMRTHLRANGVDEPLVLGQTLELRDTDDPVLDNPAASELLSTPQRAPYAVPAPDQV